MNVHSSNQSAMPLLGSIVDIIINISSCIDL